ncbi:MAG: hypothetical protein B7X86_07740 [Sphingobacteriales bacterium 17-39-43]|uniref:hypothetical protein n=1 Tax=Daejeonella sp. TaxID=2805397 RepID=UPI000BC60D4F|nr:hypothetical protein [Daejeonella sp.]OYZ31539.1 MAG: hypothetical protein B7Y24_08990 [Sphingobacteriales bacterium 16-39-50]OZA24655.1 MAG: hypothetical protein B7X86_07740 [Sphingobacteriales bacterium 17-39-43]HQS05317.1 hypothetical protein [Daejeonella sp.]HQT22706.1 hypothetical protein [Daejeonella sp.]HQT57603.1 hypothetical protein [Daejeonella sp.]
MKNLFYPKAALPLLILILVANITSAQKIKEKQFIYWDEQDKISWEDFRGTAFHKSVQGIPGTAAVSRVGIQRKYFRYKESPDTISLMLRVTFNRFLSSVRANWKTDRYLEHEQLHFDMTELLARKMRRAYILVDLNIPAEGKKVPKIIRSLTEDYKAQQVAFDNDSYSSAEKQKEWRIKIDEELLFLAEYNHPVVKIPVVTSK